MPTKVVYLGVGSNPTQREKLYVHPLLMRAILRQIFLKLWGPENSHLQALPLWQQLAEAENRGLTLGLPNKATLSPVAWDYARTLFGYTHVQIAAIRIPKYKRFLLQNGHSPALDLHTWSRFYNARRRRRRRWQVRRVHFGNQLWANNTATATTLTP